ncbi:PHP domain-containing protein [Psychrobacter phenylpyruvicus]|uniref:Error-prone DNA polymerase n=1 Tax=Psychrobacter phenylpyruvicus TaxID=29432 RepID=A0A379LHD3_9GAMM|nr:PHP domain-containing protein [Psychrobacter phenylpyruvicus]SUD89983.1 error-prone DNA polymerase [Psychrobacter phenylpyruvicus]
MPHSLTESTSAQNPHALCYKRIDLHSHSTCSDGSNTPTELLHKAHEANIDIFALTDHDTLAGIPEARAVAEELGITFINGVEISCQHTLTGGYGKNKAKDKIIHVLGLGFTDFAEMNETLTHIQVSRGNRGRMIVQKMAELTGHDFDEMWQAVLLKADGNADAVGRAHIAKVLLEQEIVPTMQKAFDKYLADNKAAYVPLETLSMEDTINLIHRCGGKAVLAHPTRYNLSATRVRKLIAEFAQFGGDGCELPSNDEPLSTRRMVDRSIAEHGLQVSTGSDFHGSSMPWRKLGDVPSLAQGQTLVLDGLLN